MSHLHNEIISNNAESPVRFHMLRKIKINALNKSQASSFKLRTFCARSEVLAAINTKISVSSDVTPCSAGDRYVPGSAYGVRSQRTVIFIFYCRAL
jgi:hypothetical protein